MMKEFSTDNKKIARNTMILYIRMLLLMVVSLYTSRIVLDALGYIEYSIITFYNSRIKYEKIGSDAKNI